MRSYRLVKAMMLLCCLCIATGGNAQSRKRKKTKKKPAPAMVVQNDVLGHGFDIRFVDPLNWAASAKKKPSLTGVASKSIVTQSFPEAYHFVTTPYEYEQAVLDSDTLTRLFQGINSDPYYKAFKKDGTDKLLFVYTTKKKALYKFTYRNGNTKTLDSAMVADFSRLGRDITPEGFIARYGTHYADEVIYGGMFIKRNQIRVDDFIYSPYKEEEFKQKVIVDIQQSNQQLQDTDKFINSRKGDDFSVGGIKSNWFPEWENSVPQNAQPIEVSLKTYGFLFKNATMSSVEDKDKKVHMLDSVIQKTIKETRKKLATEIPSLYYKKYSLQFKQRLTTIVKKSMGRENTDAKDYTGDIFFGGFSKDDAILQTKPLIEYGGIRLETLITDEKVYLDRNVVITIKPEDLKRGYVSVWDDTKKLFKSEDRKTLRVSGPAEAKTRYEDALVNKVEKLVELETIDDDVYDITYTLELIKSENLLVNSTTTYNYVLDTELVAAAATGNKERLQELFNRNGNRASSGIIKSIIVNKQGDDVLNLVLDNGVIPTTADLDLAFDPDYFDREKVLILLERGAAPKNNMIYKAVAYKSADVIYALFREGATPRNNDLAYALKIYDYPTVKALMSEEYEKFVAGKNELLLAAANNDENMAAKFIALGATADAYILEKATEFDNELLKNVIVPVTEASSETLEVVAKINDTKLFDYFIQKDAKLASNKAAELATDNDNTDILDLALKNGGEATEALAYAIEKENKPAIEVSLKNKAKPDAVFAYAVEKEDITLFNDALNIYGGTPSIALQEAVKQDKLPLAQAVISTKRSQINPTETVQLAVSNESLDMVKLLVRNDADPNEGIREAIEQESAPITQYLIASGAQTMDPKLLQNAVKKENLELSKILVEQGTADVNTAIVEASETANEEITSYLLEKGATPDSALLKSMESNNEEIILLLLAKTKQLQPSFISTAARKGNILVVENLLERGLSPDDAVEDAIRYKHRNVLELLLEKGGNVTQEHLQTAISYNFFSGIDVLLNAGIDASAPFKDGQHPLHVVTTTYDKEDVVMITKLIAANAQLNARNRNGETPLHLAVAQGKDNLTVIQKLIDSGADMNVKNSSGMDILSYATDKELRNILKKLQKAQRKSKS